MAACLVAGVALAGPAAAQGDMFAGFGSKSSGAIEVDAETLEIIEENGQRVSVFSGNVTVRRGNTTLKASTIKLFSDTDSKTADSGSFRRIEASGTVYVNSKDQTVTGSYAVVDNVAQTITLAGNVVLSQGKNVIVGDRLVIDMATGKARVEQTPGKPIRMVVTPGNPKKKDGDGSAGQ
jgi:lipopolysaccharide export system protein LptA